MSTILQVTTHLDGAFTRAIIPIRLVNMINMYPTRDSAMECKIHW